MHGDLKDLNYLSYTIFRFCSEPSQIWCWHKFTRFVLTFCKHLIAVGSLRPHSAKHGSHGARAALLESCLSCTLALALLASCDALTSSEVSYRLLSRQQLLGNTGIVDFTSKLLSEDLRIIVNTSPLRSQPFPLLHRHPFQALNICYHGAQLGEAAAIRKSFVHQTRVHFRIY